MIINILPNDLELIWSATEKETIPMFALRTRIFGDILYLIPFKGKGFGSKIRTEIAIDFNDVESPTVTSAEELRDKILTYDIESAELPLPPSEDYHGIISDDALDQTEVLRRYIEGPDSVIYIPPGTYRCRNLYVKHDNKQIIINGTIKQVDGTVFDVTQDADEGQPMIYIEDATSDQLDYLEKLINEAPDYYYYVTFWDDDYTIEGGGTGQVHHNAWVSRLLSVDKINKTITIADDIPIMPNYCGGKLKVSANAKVTVLYNVFEVNNVDNVKFSGSGVLDANRANFADVNPVWISGEVGHPEFEGAGANFIECISVRFGNSFELKDLELQNGKDNIMMWYMGGTILVDGVDASNAHNKNICYLLCNNVDNPEITGLIQNCEANGSDYEDGFLGYANADNLTYKNCIARSCPRNGFTFNRQNSNNNYAENLDAIDCGTGVGFNRGGITELLTVKNVYIEGGGRHWQKPSYQPALEIRSQITEKCGYIELINVGVICELHTSALQMYKAEEIEMLWEPTCADRYKVIKGKFSLPHSYGYFLRIDPQCSNIVIDGGGVLEVSDFPYLFKIEHGSTGIVIKNCRFSNYLSIGEVDTEVTLQDNYFDDVFCAEGYPPVPPSIEMLELDANLDVTKSGADVSGWDDQSEEENDASQATGSLQPDWMDAQINGLPAIIGDGVDDILELTEPLNCSGDFTLFAVIGGAVTPNYMFGYSSTLFWRFTGYSLIWKNSTSQIFDHRNVPLTDGYFLHRLTRVSDSCRSYRNTVESLSGELHNSVNMLIRYIFSCGPYFGVGGIARLRVVAGTLSESEIKDIEDALMLEFGLEVPEEVIPVTGIILSLDASLEVTSDDSKVSLWDDQSGSENDASQSDSDLQPEIIEDEVNGLPVIKGDGINDILNLKSAILIEGDFVVFIVCGGTTGPSYMFGYSSTIYTKITQNSVVWRNSTTHTFNHSNVPLTTDYFIHHIVRRSGQVRSYRNGVESLTGAVANSLQYALNKLFSFGSSYGSAGIADFRFGDETVTDEDIANILTELSVKFNIPI